MYKLSVIPGDSWVPRWEPVDVLKNSWNHACILEMLSAVQTHHITVCETNHPILSAKIAWVAEEHNTLKYKAFKLVDTAVLLFLRPFPFPMLWLLLPGHRWHVSRADYMLRHSRGPNRIWRAEILSVRADPRASALRSAVQIPGVVPRSGARLV